MKAVPMLCACLMLFVVSTASAEQAPEEIRQFAKTGVGAGQTSNPRGMATDPDTGHVYVAEATNQRVSEFDAWGEFVRAWGWGVVSGGAAGSGDLTAGSASVTSVLTTSKAFKVGQTVLGSGIPAGTTIVAVGAGTMTLSQAATQSGVGVPLSVSAGANNVPVNEQQTVTLAAGVTGGNFKLTYTTPNPSNSTATTANIPYNATPVEVEAALAALPNIGPGNVAVTSVNPGGGAAKGGPYVVTFGGTRFADTDVNQMTVAAGSPPLAGGSATVATTIIGGNAAEVCTTGCQAGLSGSNAGQLASPVGVALDSSGNVYVAEFANRRIQKFDPSGNFLLMFGGGVNKTTAANICTKADLEAGKVCGAGSTGSAQGQFGVWKSVGNFIAISGSDAIYVGDNNRIQAFAANGSFQSEIPLASPECGFVDSLAIEPSGNLWVACEQAKLPGIRRISPAGAVLGTIASSGESPPQALVPKALAADSAGRLYVVDGSSNPIIRKFDSAGVELTSFGRDAFTASTGIAVNSIGDVYVSNGNPTNSYIRSYGPLPYVFGLPPSQAPTVGAQYATSVGVNGAAVRAEINPHFFATTYYVEYGLADCAANPCAAKPVPPGAALSGLRDRFYETAEVALSGLTPGATYHYRFIAQSDGGGPVPGADRIFTTYRARGIGLPDGRAFEMVSPADKHSGDAARPNSYLVDNNYSAPLQASTSGDQIVYPSLAAFGGAVGAPAVSHYLARRDASGWSNQNITAPNSEGQTDGPVRGFSSDLSFTAVAQKEPTLAAGAAPGFENLYLRDNESGAFEALTTETPRITVDQSEYCVDYAGASADSSHVIFSAEGALTPGAPEGEGFNLYEWTASTGLRLVSVLEDESPAPLGASTGFGPGKSAATCGRMQDAFLRHAISDDGSRIFWTDKSAGSRLFARLDGTETIQLDAAQGGPGPAGGGQFWTASTDGGTVFFTAANRLTAGAGAAGLYRYDVDARALSSLTPDPGAANVLGVLGASDDGASVYFAAAGALAPGATAGQANLYLWQEGEPLRFIATLSADDASSWSKNPTNQTARVTPDGRHLAFVSVAGLTGRDSTGPSCEVVSPSPLAFGPGECSQVFLYDADAGELICASCNPSGARPAGPSVVPSWITSFEQPRYLSDDGGRLFFESYDRLAMQDTNATRDVYEFEREGLGSCDADDNAFDPVTGGCLYPISAGPGSGESYFADASSEGDDVFFSTPLQLLPGDVDQNYDVYDARVGGGFPPSPPPPPACLGEACRPAQAPPSNGAPSSSGFFGEGNVRGDRARGPHCPKGKRPARRGGKKVCIKRHPGKRTGHNRRAAR
jgi:sugar lactone lactonase YvrE